MAMHTLKYSDFSTLHPSNLIEFIHYTLQSAALWMAINQALKSFDFESGTVLEVPVTFF